MKLTADPRGIQGPPSSAFQMLPESQIPGTMQWGNPN